MFDLHNKKVLVTGSTQGIGLAIAKCLADFGAAVYVNGVSDKEKTKAAAKQVKNIAKQLAPYGVTVNNLSPGVIETPRNEQVLSDAEYKSQVLKGIPCGYAGSPRDCAAGALLLCSDEGRYITGTDLVIDGGMHL